MGGFAERLATTPWLLAALLIGKQGCDRLSFCTVIKKARGVLDDPGFSCVALMAGSSASWS
jgi:hypothetical protein